MIQKYHCLKLKLNIGERQQSDRSSSMSFAAGAFTSGIRGCQGEGQRKQHLTNSKFSLHGSNTLETDFFLGTSSQNVASASAAANRSTKSSSNVDSGSGITGKHQTSQMLELPLNIVTKISTSTEQIPPEHYFFKRYSTSTTTYEHQH